MNQQSSRQLQERDTSMTVAQVLDHAIQFFSRQSGVYSAFPEKRSARHVMLRGQGGEEIAIAAREQNGVTLVSGSSYLFDQQVARFLDALPPAPVALAIVAETMAATVPATPATVPATTAATLPATAATP